MGKYNDFVVIPIDQCVKAIEKMPYGSPCRVMFSTMFITGCRKSELDRMYIENLKGEYLYWKLGKNQKSWRKEKIPPALIKEILFCRNSHPCKQTQLFPILAENFRRKFDELRKTLKGPWLEKSSKKIENFSRTEYRYQLKSLRKGFATVEFARNYQKWHDCYMAMEMTSKRMKHKSTKITAYHYVEEYQDLNAERYAEKELTELLNTSTEQRPLLEFLS